MVGGGEMNWKELITICGKKEAQRLVMVRRWEYAISIMAPGAPVLVHPDVEHLLTLYFDDVHWREDGAVWPKIEHVQAILDVGQTALTRQAPLLIHCHMGFSRSPAAALAIVAEALGPGKDIDACEVVRTLAPDADLNRLMVEHADAILERNGALVRAVEDFFGVMEIQYDR